MTTVKYQFGLFLLFFIIHNSQSKRDCPGSKFGHECGLSCHCKDNASCDEKRGTCPNSCAAGWSGPACQRKNVAFGAPVNVRRVDRNGIEAVDDDWTTCLTSRANKTGWLTVDLGSIHRIYSMKLLAGDNVSLLGWKIHVSNYNHEDQFWQPPCTILNYQGSSADFQCDDYEYGQFVSIFSYMRAVNVCEFQIYACSNYTYGQTDCDGRCSCYDSTEVCNSVYGTCRTGCKAGLKGSGCNQACMMSYGSNCVHSCGHCYGGKPCDRITGGCDESCAPGWRGTTCKDVCEPGVYGYMCSSACGHCKDGGICNPETGTCPMGCKAGWYGNTCTLECRTGRYGENCRFGCLNCKMSSCNRIEGTCSHGCSPGWEGVFCNQACLDNRYGKECQETCGHCQNSTCDISSGSCGHNGCAPGYYGEKCLHECPAGKFGSNCRYTCGYCVHGLSCDPRDGSCPDNCKAGWAGEECLEQCPYGMYGAGCNATCGLCKDRETCHYETGLCLNGCAEGFHGDDCNASSTKFTDNLSDSLMATMSATIGSILVLFLALLLTCIIIKWRREYTFNDYNHRVKRKLLPKGQMV